MSKPQATPIDHSGFQLDRKALDINAGLANGLIDNAFAKINDLDINHDGKSDISQIAVLGAKALPVLIKLSSAVDIKELETWVLAQPFAKDKAAVAEVMKDLEALAEEAAKFAPKS